MTENKALKRAVRARMAKTGERYTAARHHVVEPEEELRAEDLPQPDAGLRERTGRGWREWFRILDAWGAKERKHGEIASHLQAAYGVPGWWAQAITLGYERARGLRAKHQTLTGSFQVSVSKTFPLGAGTLFRAFADEPGRDRWLEPGTLAVRTAREAKSVRFDFGGGASRVVAYLEAKGEAKTTVTVQHEKLPDAGSVEEMRAFWKERLERLATVLRA
ncbi:MAG TPA: DUF4287 domain-containing protein [Gaiellaceae bacterium]|nr:DUF4287 domain-containing protein [Gaiellaceae bacterium]